MIAHRRLIAHSVACSAAPLLVLVVLFGFGVAPARADSWQPLLRHLPAHANVLVMVHADKVRASKFAQQARWMSADNVHAPLPSILPRQDVQRCLLAARLNLASFAPRWEAAVLETNGDESLAQFAAKIDGKREQVGTIDAVRLPFDSYLVKLATNTFGVLGPADRQLAAKWGRESVAQSINSPYLLKIATFPQTVGTEIMLGLDLRDAIDLESLRQVTADSLALREAKVSPDTAADVLSSIEGVALGVIVRDEADGVIRIDFTRDPAQLAPALKKLLLERLARHGAMLDEFENWTLEVKGKTAYFGGKFTPTGLARVLSLVEPSIPAAPSTEPAAATATTAAPPTKLTQSQSATKASAIVVRSQEHYKKVSELVTAVRFPTLDLKTEKFGIWIDKQARRIDELPVLNVDPDLLDYSQGAAKSLRVSAAKLRGATIRASANQRNTYSYGYYYGGNIESDARIQGRMEKAAGDLEHVDIMRMIDDETAAIRRRMTERYGVEF
jgi:hypothetical protein